MEKKIKYYAEKIDVSGFYVNRKRGYVGKAIVFVDRQKVFEISTGTIKTTKTEAIKDAIGTFCNSLGLLSPTSLVRLRLHPPENLQQLRQILLLL